MGVMQRVDDVSNVTPADDQSKVTKDAQLMGDRRLGHPQRRGKRRNGAGALPQPAQKPYAARGREARHNARDALGLLGCDTDGAALTVAHQYIVTCTYVHVGF